MRPMVADHYRFVTGVDTHARTHTLAIIEAGSGQQVDTATFPATPAGNARAATWLARRTGSPEEVLVSMEGTGSYGASLSQELIRAGYRVVEAPSPQRSLGRRNGKSDELDAVQAARAVLGVRPDQLTEPKTGAIRAALRVLSTAREGMTRQRTASINSLTALLRTIDLGVDARKPLTQKQIETIAAWRTRKEDVAARVSRAEAVRQAKQIIELKKLLVTNAREMEELVTQLAPELLTLPGVGAATAAVILTSWSHPGRIRSEAALATLAGTSPIPASSGNTVRHRLNRGGDRRLNRAIHTIAIVRMNHSPRTREYVSRRTVEGRSKKEIIRSLKRYITREIYRTLNTSMRT